MVSIPDEILPACTVRIDVRDKPAGTGFFVGRGLIVTCAHVVESSGDPSTPVRNDDIAAVITSRQTDEGMSEERRIAVAVRRFAPLPKQDLAVLEVRSLFDHPSVLLDSSTTLGQDELHTFAYPERKPTGVPRGLTSDGRTGDGLVAISKGQVQSGMSGAPLYNRRTGGVCGVISISRDRRQDLGGYAISTRQLFDVDPVLRRENGRAHEGDSAWVRALDADQRRRWQTAQAVSRQATDRTFTVSLGQTEHGWSVTATEAGRPDIEQRIDLNAAQEEVARIFRDWASRGRVQESEQQRLLGGILFSAAFPQPIGDRLRELSNRSGDPVAVNLRFESGLNDRVIQLPWEHLCIPEDAEREIYLATDEHFSLARVMSPTSGRVERPNLTEGLSITVVSVHGVDDAPWSSAAPEVGERITKLAEKYPSSRTRLLDNPDVDELGDSLSDDEPTVLHYVGTGEFRQARDEIALGPAEEVQHGPVEMLIDALPPKRPRLVILEIAGLPPANVVSADFSVFAPKLIEHGVEAVVAYQYPVNKSATNRFNRELYQCLLAGEALEVAAQKARGAMNPFGPSGFVSPAVFLAAPGPLPLCLPTASVEPGSTSDRSSSWATANV